MKSPNTHTAGVPFISSAHLAQYPVATKLNRFLKTLAMMSIFTIAGFVVGKCAHPDGPSFAQFLAKFPKVQAPLVLKDADFSARRAGAMIPASMTKRYICDVPGSDWVCVEATGDAEMDYNTLKSYYAFGRMDLPDGSHVLLYGIYFLGCGELYHATYAIDGHLLHRQTIAGNDCELLTLSAEIASPQAFTTYKTEFKYGHVVSMEHVIRFTLTKFQQAANHEWQKEEQVYLGEEARAAALAHRF